MFRLSKILDGSLAGDAGFDPVRFAKNKEMLFLFREAEIKHARIAMLAALGSKDVDRFLTFVSRFNACVFKIVFCFH